METIFSIDRNSTVGKRQEVGEVVGLTLRKTWKILPGKSKGEIQGTS